MRISDWSSDVCSSDLIRRLHHLRRDAARRLEGGVEVPSGASAAEAGEGKAFAGEALRNVSGGVDPQHEEGNAARAATPQGGEAVRYLFDAGAELGTEPVALVAVSLRRRQERRSEEHTSELQSLMRTSYAVFCLQ